MGEGGGWRPERSLEFLKKTFLVEGFKKCDLSANRSNGGTFVNYTQECKDAKLLACEKRVYSSGFACPFVDIDFDINPFTIATNHG